MTESTRWNIRHVYLYLVCFATLMMVVIGVAQLATGLIDAALPEPNRYPTAIELKDRYATLAQKDPSITQQDIERQAAVERAEQERLMRLQRIRGIVHSLALVVVAFPVYLYHWRTIRQGT